MVWTTRHEAVSIGGDVTRTKIERVGRHLLIGGAASPIASIRAYSFTKADVQWCNVWSDNDAMDDAPIVAHGWTAREILEVAYGGGEWLYHPKPSDVSKATIDEIESQSETIRSLHTAIDDLTRAGLEMERAKNEEIAVLREALRRVLERYLREGDGVTEDAWDDVAAAMILAKPDGVRFDEAAVARGPASIHEAAGVGR